jgi:hypothetical protein
MKLYVSKEVVQATTDCKKGFSCLEGNREDLCKIGTCIDKEVHFIACLNEINCSYQRSYGEDIACDCPIRKRLYNKYKI